MEQWAAGSFQSANAQETTVANAQAIGQGNVLKQIVELDYDEFEAIIDPDSEFKRATPSGPRSPH